MTARPSQRTAESLGAPLYSHASSRANIFAGIILGLAMIGGSIALGWLRANGVGAGAETSIRIQLLNWASVAALFGGGVALLVWMWMLFSFRIWICPEGFYYTWNGKSYVFAWDEIVEVHETVTHEAIVPTQGAARHVTPTQVRRSYRIRRCDGREFSVGINTLRHVSVLGGPLKAAAERLGIPWHTKEDGRRPTSRAR